MPGLDRPTSPSPPLSKLALAALVVSLTTTAALAGGLVWLSTKYSQSQEELAALRKRVDELALRDSSEVTKRVGSVEALINNLNINLDIITNKLVIIEKNPILSLSDIEVNKIKTVSILFNDPKIDLTKIAVRLSAAEKNPQTTLLNSEIPRIKESGISIEQLNIKINNIDEKLELLKANFLATQGTTLPKKSSTGQTTSTPGKISNSEIKPSQGGK